MKYAYVLLVLALLVVGCVGTPNQSNSKTADGTGSEAAPDKDSADTQIKQCKETIDYKVLVEALPKSIAGYTASEPEGNTLTFQDPTSENTMKYSTASVSFSNEDKSIDVSIMDTCYIQFLSMSWLAFYEMDGTDGYVKKTTIDGNPGWHQYEKDSNRHTYNLIVKERVIVSINGGQDVPEGDVASAANGVDYGRIAGAAN